MTREKTGRRQWAGWLSGSLLDSLESLAAGNFRTVTEELTHAIERHLESPPVVTRTIETPAIKPATVSPPEAPPTKKRGRPRKQTPPQ